MHAARWRTAREGVGIHHCARRRLGWELHESGAAVPQFASIARLLVGRYPDVRGHKRLQRACELQPVKQRDKAS